MGEILRCAVDGEAARIATIRKALLVRGFDVLEYLDDVPPTPERSAAFAAIEPLRKLPVAKILENATPFFWLNVDRFYDAAQTEGDSLQVATGRLLLSAFDSFFECFPANVELRARLGTGSQIVLPRLRVLRSCEADEVVLVRTAFQSDRSLPTLNVPGTDACVLPVRDPILFEDAYQDRIMTKCDPHFPHYLATATRLISTVDPATAERIRKNISWYVPIVSPEANVHCSFTSPRLHGVIFLSQSDDVLRLSEALVHEYAHMELDVLMSVEPLTGDISPDERFYSPWRQDPRPIAGLFHALHVFSEVLSFLAGLMQRGTLNTIVIRQRMTLIAHRLCLGIAQVPRERLSPLGASILHEIKENTHARMHRLDAVTPLLMHDHLREWLRSHPELASMVVATV